MSKAAQSVTKQVTLTATFLRAASADPEGSLAFMILSAFGVTLAQCQLAVTKMMATNDVSVMLFCITAGVQIRGNTVFVGPQYGKLRDNYPILIIEGTRDQKDTFNFGACHVCGHILAELTNEALGSSILSKAGCCVTGEGLLDTDAGRINGEIFKSFTSDDKIAFKTFDAELTPELRKVVDAVFVSIPKLSAKFAATNKPI